MSFQQFTLSPRVLMGAAEAGFTQPTPIQERAIQPALDGHDLLGLAQTGTGKTAAYVLPVLDRLLDGPRGIVRGLVVAPTRELAEQINDDIVSLGKRTRLSSTTIYGGVGLHTQSLRLKAGVDIVVACPGRLLDHVRQGNIDLSAVEVLVLDEADMMFDMGFLDDIRTILQQTSARSQTLLFSATMPEPLRQLADEAMRNPVVIEAGRQRPAETVTHALYPVQPHLKVPLTKALLRSTSFESMIIFTHTRHGAHRLWRQLSNAGFNATCLRGKLSQRRRQEALEGFRRGKYSILVATDLAARGLDISRVSHVINHDFPPSVDAYIHRIGRTGRASRTGMAMTIVTPEDEAQVVTLERAMDEQLLRLHLDMFDYTQPEKAPVKPSKEPRKRRLPKGMLPRLEDAREQRGGKSALPARAGAGKAKVLYRPPSGDDEKVEPKPASRAVSKVPPKRGGRRKKDD